MPQVIQHIDAIARKRARDVLYLEFHPTTRAAQRAYEFEQDPTRAATLTWLDQHGLGWQPCGPIADPAVMASYLGQVYVDVPYDEAEPSYQLLRAYLEFPDRNVRQPGVRFYLLTLKFANTNKEHDEPGFRERWADSF